MATVLPHAPPTKATLPHAGTALAKPGAHPEPLKASLPRAAFQALLDHAAYSAEAKKSGKIPEAVPVKAKAVTSEPALEKPKETKDHKKTDPKDHKSETDTGAQVAVLTGSLPKADQPGKPNKAPESDTASDRAKSVRTERRAPGEPAKPGPVPGAEVRPAASQGVAAKDERTDDKPRVFVVDRRSDKEKEKLKLPGAEAAAQQPVNASPDAQNQPKTADAKAPGADVQVNFQVAGKGKEGFDLTPQNAPISPRDAASFQQYLVERGYGQMVDQARIILKDQNAGEIRMTLYPETLGKVKVSLNLTDSSLAGQIFVENQTVKDVFQSNMDGLLQAFRDGGWNELSLQVSVGGGGGNQAGQGQPQAAPQVRDYDRQVAQTITDARTDRIGSWNDRQVNLTA